MDLAIKLTQPFNKLTFKEEEHKYFVEGNPLKTSVSGCIKLFYEPFDDVAKAKEWEQTKGIPAHITLAEWKETNDEAKNRGHRVHSFGELYQFDRSLKPSCPQEEAIVAFWASLPEHIIPVAAELRMYHFQHLFAGTADIILFDTKTQTYIIADYKTNKDLLKNYKGKTMLAPFEALLDCPLNHYVIQLSYYQILLEQIGVKVTKRVIIWLGLDGKFTCINTDDVTSILKTNLEKQYVNS